MTLCSSLAVGFLPASSQIVQLKIDDSRDPARKENRCQIGVIARLLVIELGWGWNGGWEWEDGDRKGSRSTGELRWVWVQYHDLSLPGQEIWVRKGREGNWATERQVCQGSGDQWHRREDGAIGL